MKQNHETRMSAGPDDGETLKLIYCSSCGTPVGRLDNGSRCGLLCSKCKTEYVFTLQEGAVSQRPMKRPI